MDEKLKEIKNLIERAERENKKKRNEIIKSINEKFMKEMEKDIEKVIEGDGKYMVEYADVFAMYLGKIENMTTSQIRNIFGEIKRMPSSFEDAKYELQKIRYKLAYIARHKEVKKFRDVMDQVIKKVRDDKSFARFKDFFEAVVAYHRYYGKE